MVEAQCPQRKNAKTGLDTRETRHADGGLGRKDDLGSIMHTVVNNYPGEHWPPMPLRIPPNYNIDTLYIYYMYIIYIIYSENLCIRGHMAAKGILPPPLRVMFSNKKYPLRVLQSPMQ